MLMAHEREIVNSIKKDEILHKYILLEIGQDATDEEILKYAKKHLVKNMEVVNVNSETIEKVYNLTTISDEDKQLIENSKYPVVKMKNGKVVEIKDENFDVNDIYSVYYLDKDKTMKCMVIERDGFRSILEKIIKFKLKSKFKKLRVSDFIIA